MKIVSTFKKLYITKKVIMWLLSTSVNYNCRWVYGISKYKLVGRYKKYQALRFA